MFGDIDITKIKPRKPQLFLCKPDFTTISKLSEAYDIKHVTRLADINEISFSLPYLVEKRREIVPNPNIENVRERYLIKVKLGHEIEYYLITQISDSADDDENVKEVKAYSLGYQLRDKSIRSYNVIGVPAIKAVRDVLSQTNWNVGENLMKDVTITYNPDKEEEEISIGTDAHYFNRSASAGGAGGRTFDMSAKTVLDAIIEIAEKFNAVIRWDTVRKTVDFEVPEAIGQNKGLKVSYGKYLQSLSRESNADEMVTRLTPYGYEEITVHAYNPTGSGFLEDFSFFMFPFRRDINRNVLQSSNYMSDGLCHAILDYQEKVESYQGRFSTLLNKKADLDYNKGLSQNKLIALTTEKIVIEDMISAKKSINEYHDFDITTIGSKTVEHNKDAKYIVMGKITNQNLTVSIDGSAKPFEANKWSILAKKDVGSESTKIDVSGTGEVKATFVIVSISVKEFDEGKDSELLTKYNIYLKKDAIAEIDAELDTIEAGIKKIQSEISTLQQELSIERNFTPEQIVERNDYIIEREISNDSIMTDEELYNWAVEEFEKLHEPQMVIDIDIINFLDIVEAYRDWNKLSLGDTIKIHHEELGVDVSAKIIEIDYSYENSDINLTIANVKDIKTDEDILTDALYGAVSTSTTVDMNKFKWDKVQIIDKELNTIMTEPWDVAKRMIQTASGDVKLDRAGLKIISRTNPNEYLIASSGVLAITNDDGRTWKHAITTEGVIGERIIGKIIIGEQLYMENSSGTIKFNSEGLTIHNSQLKITFDDGTENSLQGVVDKINDTLEQAKTDLQGEINDIKGSLENIDEVLGEAFKDSIIDEAERIAIQQNIEQLNSQKADIDSRYTAIYNNIYLLDEDGATDKAVLLARKNDFDIKHQELLNAITSAMAEDTVIDDVRANVSSKFTAYNIALSGLSTAFVNALDNISKNKAKSAETNAKDYADSLKTEIDENINGVSGKLNDLNEYVDGSFKDGVISESEKFTLLQQINLLNVEKSDVDKRYDSLVTNVGLIDKTPLTIAKNNYNTAHQELLDAIISSIEDNEIIEDEKANVDSKFTAYTVRLGELSVAFENAVDNIAEFKKQEAIGYADDLKLLIKQDISDVDGKLNDLNDYIDTSFKDGIIEFSEAKAINTYLNIVNSEKADIDTRYANVYNNPYLLDVKVKTNLFNTKSLFDTAHTELINAITDAIADGRTNSAESALVDIKFDNYKTTLSNLSNAFEQAIDNIAKSKADEAFGNSKDYTDSETQAGKDAWSKFSGENNTLPSGNVLFGNGLTADSIEKATLNFNDRNDRMKEIPRDPVVGRMVSGDVVDAIDHTVNTDGSVDISFEWDFDDSGNEGNIDGFIVYVMQGTSSGKYSFGTTPQSEQVYYVTQEKRALILYGVPANRYYTFGVQAYRMVDEDINSSGVLKSAIVKDTSVGHDPYRPELNVAFNGSITGTIVDSKGNSHTVATVTDKALGSLQSGVSYNTVTIDSTSGLVATRSDGKSRTVINATSGIIVQKFESNNWTNKFYVDTEGNLNITGNINMQGGSISWGDVEKPKYTAEELGAITSDSKQLTYIDQNGVYTGTVVTNQLVAGTAKITTAMIETLEVGKNVLMGKDAVISWNDLTDKPTIPTKPSDIGALSPTDGKLTHITSTGLYTGTISAEQISAGVLTGMVINGGRINSTVIDIYGDMVLGEGGVILEGDNGLVSLLGGSLQTKRKSVVDEGVELSGRSFVDVTASKINLSGTVTVNGQVLKTDQTAKFA